MNDTKKEITEISLEDIIPNRFQPRLTFDPEALNDLANSIKEHGIIQPLVVRKLQDKYEIIAGERRYKAAAILGLSKVPCIIMDLNDNESAEVAVIENIQRKEMTPLEEAKSFKKILDKGYLTQDELAKRMGKSQSSIANKLRLLNLDEVVQEAILNGKISERHARSLLKIENKQDQRDMLNEIINNRLTVRQTDEKIKEKFNIVGDKMNNEISNIENNIEEPIEKEEQKPLINIFKEPIKEEPKQEVPVNPYEGFKSTPEVNIPIIKDTMQNPQVNLINDIEQKNVANNSNNLDIFKYEESNVTPVTNQNVSNQNIENIINPSVFTEVNTPMENQASIQNNNMQENNSFIQENNTPTFIQETNSMNNDININNNESASLIPKQDEVTTFNIDINEVKNNAQDIIKKEENPVNVEALMTSEKPENKFFVDLNVPVENIQEPLPFKVQSALDSINRRIEEIKMQGTTIRKEEKNLDNSYQVIITIDK